MDNKVDDQNTLIYSILHLFAILASQDNEKSKNNAEKFLKAFLNEISQDKDIEIFIEYFRKKLSKYPVKDSNKAHSFHSVRYLKISNSIKKDLNQDERNLVFLRLLEFVSEYSINKKLAVEFIKLIADVFNIQQNVYKRLFSVLLPEQIEIDEENSDSFYEGLSVIYLSNSEIYYKVKNHAIYDIANKFANKFYSRFEYYQVIELNNGKKLYYSDLINYFDPSRISSYDLSIYNLKYKTSDGKNLFNGLSVKINTPGMIAVSGQSGSGKSTLLRILSGTEKEIDGEIYYPYEKTHVSYVPQEDSIDPDLPVYKQVYNYCRVLKYQKPENVTKELLKKTGLYEIKDQKPGNLQDTRISGGERKRLAITLGLISNPQLLLCDEPTSGLSFEDAIKIVSLLRDVSNEGALVITSLHQPEDRLLNYFDKLLYLDIYGKPVYYGVPHDFENYIIRYSNTIKPELKDNYKSSLSNAEYLLRKREPDEFGRATGKRINGAEYWEKIFRSNEGKTDKPNGAGIIKHVKTSLFNRIVSEFSSLFHRKTFFFSAIIYAPFMAVLLSIVTRYPAGNDYEAGINPHLSVFFIMTIVVALFSGYIFSTGELSRDILKRKREWINERSNTNYYLSKIIIQIPVGIYQSIVFAAISCSILESAHLLIPLGLVYFALFVFAVSQGFILSLLSGGKSWAYILIPVLIIPQILFSGAMIRWNEFPGVKRGKAPVISAIMPSAWGYEALMTETILNSDHYSFNTDKKYHLSEYFLRELIPLYEKMNKQEKIDDNNVSDYINEILRDAEIIDYNKHDDIQVLKEKLKNNLNIQSGLNNNYFGIWYYLQDMESKAYLVSKDEVIPGNYDFYFTGNLFSDKAAFIDVGLKFRHSVLSIIMILVFSFFHFSLILAGLFSYPYKNL